MRKRPKRAKSYPFTAIIRLPQLTLGDGCSEGYNPMEIQTFLLCLGHDQIIGGRDTYKGLKQSNKIAFRGVRGCVPYSNFAF